LIEITLGATTYYMTDFSRDVSYGGNTYASGTYPLDMEATKISDGGNYRTASLAFKDLAFSAVINTAGGSIRNNVVIRECSLDSDYAVDEIAIIFQGQIIGAERPGDGTLRLSMSNESQFKALFPRWNYSNDRCQLIYKSDLCACQSSDPSCDKSSADCISKGNIAHFLGFLHLPPAGEYFYWNNLPIKLGSRMTHISEARSSGSTGGRPGAGLRRA